MTTRLLLIRHGKPENHTDEGVRFRMSGWTDFPLSVRGRAQATRLAEHLARKDSAIDALYASPLRRAASTAEIVSQALSMPLELVAGAREIFCGSVDGMPIEEVKQSHPRAWDENLRQDNEDFRWPGGESYREFRARCMSTLEALAGLHDGQRIALVTHAGVISQVFGVLNGASAARWEPFRPGMTAVSEVEWNAEPRRALRFDDCTHLRA